MKTYFALVHKDEVGAYGISFPDLPGCFSAADDLDDLVKMPARRSICGLRTPRTSSHAALRKLVKPLPTNWRAGYS